MAGHTGQTLNDRLNAARYALAGQGLARVVCKATTEEVIGPKKKHLDYLLQCTHEPNVSIPQLANLLIERTNHSSWVVVFKALVTVHHLMCYGNERFTQYLASSNCTFQLSNFLDKTGVKGYEMSTFIRRYAKYLNEKALSYRTVAFDFTKIKRGKEDGSLRSMNTDKLIKTIPTLQSQVDSLLEFDCNANDLTNGVINAAFMLLFRDLIRLFACYNDGIINCLEKYFDMNKKQAREALDIYKKFLIRMDKVSEFLKVAENVGIDKGEIPDLTKAPSSLLDALEQHLAQLEGKKGQSTANINSENSSSSPPTNGTSNGSLPNEAFKETDTSVKKALEEEERMLNQLKINNNNNNIDTFDSPLNWQQENWSNLEKHMQDKDKDDRKTNNPFLSMSPTAESKASPTAEIKSQGLLDLFNDSQNISTKSETHTSGKASDDLLCLSNANPFADILNAANNSQPPVQSSFPSMAPNMVPLIQNQTAFNGLKTTTTNGNNVFASDDGFAAAFGKSDTTSASGTDVIDEVSDQVTHKLPVPSVEEPNRSASPSPTHDIIRGAGTTPILPVPPDLGFGEDSGIDDSNNISRGNSPSPAAAISAPPPSGENSPFGQPMESSPFAVTFEDNLDSKLSHKSGHCPPARPPPPPHEQTHQEVHHEPPHRPPPPTSITHENDNFFGNDADFDTNFGEAAHSQPPIPSFANIPFASLDPTQQQYIIQQQLLLQQQQQRAMSSPQLQQKPPKKASAFEDLDLAMRSTMAKPTKPVGEQPQQEMMANMVPPQMVYIPPGSVPPAGFISIPGMPSYGIAAGAAGLSLASEGFDAFGDVLQPQLLANKSGQILQTAPTVAPTIPTANVNQSLFKGDLDSSLASLAQNLDINGPKGGFKKPGQQFSSPKNTVKTGAPVQAQTQPNVWNPSQQMGGWSAGGMPIAAQPAMIPTGGQWAAAGGQPIMVPNQMPMSYGVQMRPGMVGGMVPQVGAVPVLPGAVPVLPNQTAQRPVNPGLANTQSDPFGAL